MPPRLMTGMSTCFGCIFIFNCDFSIQGIRLAPEQIAAAARDEDVDVVGISILSGSHLELVPEVLRLLREQGVDAPVIVGGIIPTDDQSKLESLGVAAVYTPKDFELGRIMADISRLAESHRSA